MGIFSKKQTTKSTQNTTSNNTSTATPNVPTFISKPTEQIAGNIQGLIDQGPGGFTPQVSALQQKSFADAGNLTNSRYLGDAGAALTGTGAGPVGDYSAERASAAGILDNGLEQYYNPFRDQIIDPVMADLDLSADKTRAIQAAAAARNRAFQGSRYGITEGQTEGELARARGSTLSPLLSGMYTQATGMAEADTGRRQQVNLANQAAGNRASEVNQSNQQANRAAEFQRAQQLAALGLAEGGESRANLGVQAGMGAAQTDQENAIRQYPIQYQQQMSQLLAGLNPELYTGKTITSSGTETGSGTSTTKASDLLGTLGQGAQIAALFASDARLKQDVETVGYDAKGRRWVSFAYIWAPLKRFVGVIAQEILRTDPHAVRVGGDGYLMVNYAELR